MFPKSEMSEHNNIKEWYHALVSASNSLPTIQGDEPTLSMEGRKLPNGVTKKSCGGSYQLLPGLDAFRFTIPYSPKGKKGIMCKWG